MIIKKAILFFALMVLATFVAAVEVRWSVAPTVSPAAPNVGNTVAFGGQIIVTGGTVLNLVVHGGVDETRTYNRTFARIDDGETRSVSFNWTATAGSHRLWLNIDPDNVSGDANMYDNLATGGVHVSDPRSRPDLHIWWSSFNVVPTRFNAGDSVTFHIGFGNIGTADAGPFDVGIRSGGAIVARQHFDGLAAGGNTTVDLTWTAACNDDNALIIDCDHTVAEPNEEDNTLGDDRLHCDSSWHENLNFYFENVRPDTSAAPLTRRSTPTTVSADLKFTGGVGRGALNVRVDMGIVGGATFTHTFPALNLPGNETNPVSFSAVLPAGDNRVFFEVDRDRHLAEMNEGDNRLEDVIRVEERAPGSEPISREVKKAAVSPYVKVNYGVAITNKAELTSVPPGSRLPLKVEGKLSVAGTPAASKITVYATLSTGDKSLPVTRSTVLALAADSKIPFAFSFSKPAKGKYKVKVEVRETDADASDNSDSAAVGIL
jgi:CARDB